LVDADLSILGTPPALYDGYARAVRAEYSWVATAAYRDGRTAVLGGILARPSIYLHQSYQDLFESQARVNLSRELAELATTR
jgi:predicted metal-dependent HD superfamily phosphohydrolase